MLPGMDVECVVCGREFVWSGRGRQPLTCGQRCRKRKQRAGLPGGLLVGQRWVRADGKRPVMPSGGAASSTDTGTWSVFADVQSGAGDGFGIMLGGGLACWDLDDVFESDGSLMHVARSVLDGCSPLWVERSMSGQGLHVFVFGWGVSHQSKHVSFYSHSRFIRVTGDRF